MPDRYIHAIEEDATEAGNKARLLSFLSRKGHPIPETYFCSWRAEAEYRGGREGVLADIRLEIEGTLDLGKAYAVRSSANVEDDPERSFAGQFATVLGVQGADDIVEAIGRVWDSALSSRAGSYSSKVMKAGQPVRMSVIIQEMVPPVYSGVSFSRNPMTGMDEIVIEAVRGEGTSLVQEGRTPERWVHKWGEWTSRPVDPVLPLDLLQEVVDQTRSIEEEYGKPVDLEWVYDGAKLHWVQLREITTLKGIHVYSNRISREVLPGQIKPLVWSVNVPLVNSAWIRLFTELIGPNDIDPEDLSRSFHYRAYFDMGTIGRIFEALGMPRQSLEILMGIEAQASGKPAFRPSSKILVHLPRMVDFVLDKWKFARKVRAFVPRMWSRYREMHGDDIGRLREEEILERTRRLYSMTQETAYYNIITPLLMQAYNRFLGSQLAALGFDLERIDLTRGLEGIRELDPNLYLSRLRKQYAEFDPETRESIAAASYEEIGNIDGAAQWAEDVEGFIEAFGHFSESGTDFSAVPWRETPDLVLRMATEPVVDHGGSREVSCFEDLAIPFLRRPLLRFLYSRAREFRLHREEVSSLYTFGYGLFRGYFLELGRRLSIRGIVAEPEDIFYLYLPEVEGVVGGMSGSLIGLVEGRKREMKATRDLDLPTVIFGDEPPPTMSRSGRVLKGTPTSGGYYEGPARVITSLQDSGILKEGDVLVIPYSDVGWTPLFGKAGAVVAESGGILSHSSIIAREYGIPAVVSVEGATKIPQGSIVTVDGYTGEVSVGTPME